MRCAADRYPVEEISAGHLFALWPGVRCRLAIVSDSTFIYFCPANDPGQESLLFEAYREGERLNPGAKSRLATYEGHLPVLSFSPLLADYMEGFEMAFRQRCTCGLIIRIKLEEFFFWMGYSYSLEDRRRFLGNLTGPDDSFAHLVYENYLNAGTVAQLAEKTCCSLPNFEKRFKKRFGMPPTVWIALQKAKIILPEICNSEKPFKQIAFEYGFSSGAHFTAFCRKNFGRTPSELRLGKPVKMKLPTSIK